MKTLFLNHRTPTNCEGVTRRDVLKVGSLSLLGLSLPQFFQLQTASADPKGPLPEKNCILLFMNGGASHLDTWDPKPHAPAEYRGEFNAISTNVPGIQISEHLPKMAKMANKLSLVRSVTNSETSHDRACYSMLTGRRGVTTLDYPDYGAVMQQAHGFRASVPSYVAISQTLRGGGPGYLGNAYHPVVTSDPGSEAFSLRTATRLVPDARLKARAELLPQDARLTSNEVSYSAQYLANSPKTRAAFDLSAEPEALRDQYGRNSFGQGCLLARRMVEAGSHFVTVSSSGWDTHGNNFANLRERLLPSLDSGFSTLLRDLSERGMLENTLVIWMGDFGRTPRINALGGRDHHPYCQSVVFAGGGVPGGQVIGQSDATGSLPIDSPVTPEDLATTIYQLLGLRAPNKTDAAQPARVAQQGQVVRELVG